MVSFAQVVGWHDGAVHHVHHVIHKSKSDPYGFLKKVLLKGSFTDCRA